MMPQILTTNALVLCPHGGKGTTHNSSRHWKINAGYVAVEGDTGDIACPFLSCPCSTYTLRSMNLNATKLDGKRVILVTDFNQTITGLPLVMADFHQTFDQSTPAPVPPGQPSPAPSPEFADFGSPLATPVMQVQTFSVSANLPMVLNFSLATSHPLRWILTLINEQNGQHLDLTYGAAHATIQPSGGLWVSPIQNFTVTLEPPFINAIAFPSARLHLFLTGVSRRGLSGHAEAVIQVVT
jgi:hypothetical protein